MVDIRLMSAPPVRSPRDVASSWLAMPTRRAFRGTRAGYSVDIMGSGCIPVATLGEVYRQAADSGIVQNASHQCRRGPHLR